MTFDPAGSTDPDVTGSIVSYGWDFDGDGTIDQTTTTGGARHAHATRASAASPRALTVTDDLGAKGTATVVIDVAQRAAGRGALDLADDGPHRAVR